MAADDWESVRGDLEKAWRFHTQYRHVAAALRDNRLLRHHAIVVLLHHVPTLAIGAEHPIKINSTAHSLGIDRDMVRRSLHLLCRTNYLVKTGSGWRGVGLYRLGPRMGGAEPPIRAQTA